ncbi:unnamed protein product [Effrenium voratum]|nr:unnamed protein product [Effrenium voratum]
MRSRLHALLLLPAWAYESPLRYVRILDAAADIRDLEVGDVQDMESDVPLPFLEHLREERARRSASQSSWPTSPRDFEQNPGAFASKGAAMPLATLELEWTRKHGRWGTDRLAELWATALESAGLATRLFAVEPGQVLFVTQRTEEVADIQRFVLSQPDVDFFEFNQQRSFPGTRRAPLSGDEERRHALEQMRPKQPSLGAADRAGAAEARARQGAGKKADLAGAAALRHLFVGEKHRALVGLYFGTFDPLHENHFRLVLCALRKCGARRVVLVPNQGGNPYKPSCSSLAARIAAIQERIAAAESCGELSPGEVVVREEAGANNWPQREKVAQAVEREEFADTEASAVVALLLGEDSFRKSLSQAEGKHKNTGIFQLQNKPRRLIVFPRENRPGLSLVPEKLSARVEVAPYRDLVEGLSSSQIRQLLHSGEAPDEAAVHPVVWARFKAHASREVGAVTQDSPEWSDEEMEEDAGQGWKDPESHYDAQAPQSRARRLQSPTVRLRNCNSLAKAVLLEQFLSAVAREASSFHSAHHGYELIFNTYDSYRRCYLGGRTQMKSFVAGDDHPLSVLDLGCGRAASATNYCGVDVSKASLEVLVSRVQDLQSILPVARHGLLATSREPLREVSLIHADCWHTRLEHQWDAARHGTARSPSGQCWFHLVSSQMACHYAFGTQESVEVMLENAASRLCAGGYFVGTVPDAARIIESKGKGSGELLGVTFTAEESGPRWKRHPSFGARVPTPASPWTHGPSG